MHYVKLLLLLINYCFCKLSSYKKIIIGSHRNNNGASLMCSCVHICIFGMVQQSVFNFHFNFSERWAPNYRSDHYSHCVCSAQLITGPCVLYGKVKPYSIFIHSILAIFLFEQLCSSIIEWCMWTYMFLNMKATRDIVWKLATRRASTLRAAVQH